ncbi:hypothetical protein PTI98_010964 [Pleurotus ostreatus]|nr:hypothetical protein PTI98_010964 [Pleurotus ostreatus]
MAIMEPLNRIQNKKRHTKPCKFYQMNNCPYPQEECDFAHILTGEPTFQNATPCRFYIKGHCSNGLWCRYKHSLERGSDINDPRVLRSPDIRDIQPELTQQALRRHAGKPTNPRHTDRSPDSRTSFPTSPSSESQSLHYRGPVSPRSPIEEYGLNFSMWSPVVDSPHISSRSRAESGGSPNSRHISELFSNLALSPTSFASDNAPKDSRGRNPIYPSSVSSELSPVLPSIHQAYGLTPSPLPAPTYPVTSPGLLNDGFDGHWAQEHIQRSGVSPPPGLPKAKAANYKTKPCRFFLSNRPCPNGEDCTFIHGDSDFAEKQLPTAKSAGLPLPPKPTTLQEANAQKGYFPVSWRIIGGGVPLSQDPSASSVSSGSTSSSREDVSEPLGHIARPADIPSSLSRKNKASATPLKLDVSSLPPVSLRPPNDNATTPTKMTPKFRPTSTPPTPSATHYTNIMSLFSAESPAVL